MRVEAHPQGVLASYFGTGDNAPFGGHLQGNTSVVIAGKRFDKLTSIDPLHSPAGPACVDGLRDGCDPEHDLPRALVRCRFGNHAPQPGLVQTVCTPGL